MTIKELTDAGIDPATGKRFEDLTDDEFLDCWPSIKCSDCTYHGSDDCPIFRNGRLAWFRPWFRSSGDGSACKFYYPAPYQKWLIKYWRGVGIFNRTLEGRVCFFLDGDENTMYYCYKRDFYNNQLWTETGELKWIAKCNHRKSRKSPTGWICVIEFPDGKKFRYNGSINEVTYEKQEEI